MTIARGVEAAIERRVVPPRVRAGSAALALAVGVVGAQAASAGQVLWKVDTHG
jgi:hypothetical protein